MVKRYPVLVNKDEGSAWGVSFVDLPAHIIKDTLEAALAECQEVFEVAMDGADALPAPTSLEEVAQSKEGREALSIMLVEIDTTFFDDPTERKTASAKRSQWEAIDRAASKAGKTRSAFMVGAALEAARGAEERLG